MVSIRPNPPGVLILALIREKSNWMLMQLILEYEQQNYCNRQQKEILVLELQKQSNADLTHCFYI
jgi:hypothetical protein